MLEHNSTSRHSIPQAASKPTRNEPQHLSPKQSTRKTRSQSRDLSDSEAGGRGAKARRADRPAHVEEPGTSIRDGNSKGRNGRPNYQSRALQDLSAVTEEPSTLYPEIPVGEDNEADEAMEIGGTLKQQARHAVRSPGGFSAFSGTTARTSRSAQELAALSAEEIAEDMLDALPELSDAASKLLSVLMPSDLSKTAVASFKTQLQNKDSREHKKFRRLNKSFDVPREVYGNGTYINASRMLLGLSDARRTTDLLRAQSRPRLLFHQANISILLASALTFPSYPDNESFVEELEQAFPKLFSDELDWSKDLKPDNSALRQSTLALALEIRTQCAIILFLRYNDQPDFIFDTILQQVFYKDPKNLKGWDAKGLRLEELTKDAENMILQRLQDMRQICESIGSNGSSGMEGPAVEVLQMTFPWIGFLQTTLTWAAQRLDEIDTQIASSGGAEAIAKALANEVASGRQAVSSAEGGGDLKDDAVEVIFDYNPPSELSHGTSGQVGGGSKPVSIQKVFKSSGFNGSPKSKAAVAALKQRGKQTQRPVIIPTNQLLDPDVQVAATARPSARAWMPERSPKEPNNPSPAPINIVSDLIPQEQGDREDDDDWRPQENQGEEDDFEVMEEPDPNAVIAQRVLETRDQREAESNKENLTADQVSNMEATKKLHITDRQPNAHRVPFDSQRSNEDVSENQIDEVSQDEGFRRPHRVGDPSTKRPSKGPKRSQASDPARMKRVSSKRARTHQDSAPGELGVDMPLARGIQDERSQPSQLDIYNAANSEAKARKALLPTSESQSRRPWLEEETGTLLELITKYGTSWKLLKAEDLRDQHILGSRNQVALKDKARNMKVDFLKAGRFLPRNFGRIRLSKIQIEGLKGVSIDYDPESGHRVDGILESDEQ